MRKDRTYDGLTYDAGKRFRVTKSGARLTGFILRRDGANQGWTQELSPGDEIECLGFGPGFGSDPGYGINWTSERAKAERAHSLTVSPSEGGIWSYRPVAGYLEEA
jgi:hypothetical protein